jgi:hypothetical protein
VYLVALLITFITLLISIVTKNLFFVVAWLLIIALFLLVYVIKKRSVTKTLVSLVAHTGIAISAVRGFLMAPRSPKEYPVDIEVIQLSSNRGEHLPTVTASLSIEA